MKEAIAHATTILLLVPLALLTGALAAEAIQTLLTLFKGK